MLFKRKNIAYPKQSRLVLVTPISIITLAKKLTTRAIPQTPKNLQVISLNLTLQLMRSMLLQLKRLKLKKITLKAVTSLRVAV
jgi:hypothetical protein